MSHRLGQHEQAVEDHRCERCEGQLRRRELGSGLTGGEGGQNELSVASVAMVASAAAGALGVETRVTE